MIETSSQRKVIQVGLGELHVTDDADAVLVVRGLGSCVAVCAHDPIRTVGGLLHTVLPHGSRGESAGWRAKFIDEGIPLLVQRMEELGAAKWRTIIKIVGGAKLFATSGVSGTASVGEQNAEAARSVLAGLGLRLRGEDTGGGKGRTVRLHVRSGRLVVSTIGGGSHEL
jgi:chemotaxis protein CheD